MPQVILYIAASLDGYIAKPDGNIDWLTSWPNPLGLDYGYNDLLKRIGSIVMGRKTYDEVLGFGIEWPYAEFDTYVISTNANHQLSTTRTQVVNSDIEGLIAQLKDHSEKDIWLVGGGQLVTTFMNHNLIDKMILTLVPIVLGDGIQLFPNHPKETQWKLANVETFDTGLVSLTYESLR